MERPNGTLGLGPNMRDRRWSAGRVALGTALVGTVVLLLAPAGVGALPQLSLSAPYHGSVVRANMVSTSGCARAISPVHPQFSVALGRGGFTDRASARGCAQAGHYSSNLGYAQAEIRVAVNVPITSSGPHQLVEKWNFTLSGAAQASLAACPKGTAIYSSCFQFVESYAFADTYLYDSTNASYTWASGFWHGLNPEVYNLTYYYNGSTTNQQVIAPGSFSATSFVSFYVNATLDRKHTYELVTVIDGGVQCEFDTYDTAFHGVPRGSASFNMATFGNGITLRSITVQ